MKLTVVKLSSASHRRRASTLLKSARPHGGLSHAPRYLVPQLVMAVLLSVFAAANTWAQSERALTDADVPFLVKTDGVKEEPAPPVNLQPPTRTPAADVSGVRERKKNAARPAILKIVQDASRRYAVDAELILSVMAQESNFISTAVSYKDGRPCARGLMQLTAPTAARFGVNDPFDPKQNIEGGVKYLRFLLDAFGDERLDLVLAGYNAGEGAVLRYKRNVPPYRETQNYVRTILARYNSTRHLLLASTQ